MDLLKEACFVVLKMSAPVLVASLVIGVTISFFQALTQIQEMTISFVPKLFAILVVLLFTSTYMTDQLRRFSEFIFNVIGESDFQSRT